MRFLVDAQLPRLLATKLIEMGHEARHTLDLPEGNRTSDTRICHLADEEHAVIVTKDADFVNSHLLLGSPAKLLLISTGNISNWRLLGIFERSLETIVGHLSAAHFIEITDGHIIVHG